MKTTHWDFFGDSGVVINVANIVHDHGDYNDSARKITIANVPIQFESSKAIRGNGRGDHGDHGSHCDH